MGSSCKGDALILCRLLEFFVNSFDRPPQLLSTVSLSTAGARRDPVCVGRLAPPSWLRSPLGLVACKSYVFQLGYDGKQPSIVSLGTTYRRSGNQLEDEGSLVCVLSLAYIGSSQSS